MEENCVVVYVETLDLQVFVEVPLDDAVLQWRLRDADTDIVRVAASAHSLDAGLLLIHGDGEAELRSLLGHQVDLPGVAVVPQEEEAGIHGYAP